MIKKFFILFTILFVGEVRSEELGLEEVLSSTRKHHPHILMNLYELEAVEGKVMEQESAFDTNLDMSSNQRGAGYYDGSFWDISLSKPLKVLNAKVYTGLRKSSGELPVYELENRTQDDGEARLGLQFSLWGNRDIDPKRLKLWNEEFNAKIQKNELKQVTLQLEAEAKLAFWKWQAAGRILDVYERLYMQATERNIALEKRVKRGDLAKIYLVENKQYMLKRKSLLIEGQQKLQYASLYLAFFYRDEKGKILIPKRQQLAKIINVPKLFAGDRLEQDIKSAIKNSPYIYQLDLKLKQQQNELELGETLSKPTLDFKVEHSQDYGQVVDTLEEEEQKLMLQFNLPLERNLGRGRVQAAKAKIKRIEVEQRFTKNTFKLKMTTLFQAMLNEYQIIENSSEEVIAAKTLEKAENSKFKRGASDFFLVNIREQNTASAEVKLIKAKLSYYNNYIDYNIVMAGVKLKQLN